MTRTTSLALRSIALSSIALSSLALLCTACGSTAEAPSPEIQSIVEAVASRQPGIRRLTVHAVPEGETEACVVASTVKSKLRKPSAPEDLDAMRAGHAVVLVEPGALDVTVPILMQAGKHTATAGVTLEMPPGTDRAALELRAREIAAEVESAIIAQRG